MNCGPPDQLPPVSAPSCFLNLNWDQSMAAATAGDHLDPALSSMVSSPASNSTAAAATDGRALHGISPQPQYGGTPLSSPPKLNLFHQTRPQFHHFPPPQVGCGAAPGGLPILENLMPTGHLDQFLADPGFAQRAARLSGFDGRPSGSGYGGGVAGQFGLPEAGPIGALKELELGNGRDESSVSDPASAGAEMALKGPSDGNAKKRKASAGKGKGKDGPGSAAAKEESSGKRCRSADESSGAEDNPATKGKAAQSSSENGGGKKQQGKDSAAKPPAEPPKDYIHVRARRGEATDSHSLAERVRREKISQRMKLLQDLVPGCNKVVGKAVMLDEIINYVQSLQRQVEFLSMKLATVNPQLDFNSLPNLLLPKDIHHQSTCGPAQFPLETSGAPLPYLGQPQPHHHGSPLGCMDSQSCMHPLDAAFCRPMNGPQHPFLNGASDAASQVGTFWQDDLQSVVHMDIGQSQEIAPTSSNSYNGSLQTVHMKMEL